MVAEIELYPAVEALFKENFLTQKEVPLGSKRMDLVCVDKNSGKIVAVELKVKNWKRAIRQALTYKICADEAYIALPEDQVASIDREGVLNLGIGIIAIYSTGTAKIIANAIPSTFISKNSHALTRARIVTQPESHSSNNFVQPRPIKFYLWYVAQDRSLFEKFSQTYDGFIVNAHILVHYQSAFSALSFKLNKPFFVIPDTHFLQHAPLTYFYDEKGEIRISWRKLLYNYEGICKVAIESGRNLVTQDFEGNKGPSNLSSLVKRTLDTQRAIFTQATEELRILGDVSEEAPVQNIVAPYFHFSTPHDNWYSISLQAVREATSLKSGNALFAILCMDKDVLSDPKLIDKVCNDYLPLDLDGFLLWISDFDEVSEPNMLLSGLRELVQKLSSTGKNVINLHGGYYSILLRHFGLSGFASGICYKEYADPEDFPMGGPPGGPVAKYYFPLFKTKMDRVNARVTLAMDPSLRCKCDICARELDQMLDPSTPESISRNLMRQHFLSRRSVELETNLTLPQEIQELETTLGKYAKPSLNALTTLPPILQLARWVNVLKK